MLVLLLFFFTMVVPPCLSSGGRCDGRRGTQARRRTVTIFCSKDPTLQNFVCSSWPCKEILQSKLEKVVYKILNLLATYRQPTDLDSRRLSGMLAYAVRAKDPYN